MLVSASALSSAPGQLVTDVPANGWLRQEKTHTQAIKSSRFWGNLPIRGGDAKHLERAREQRCTAVASPTRKQCPLLLPLPPIRCLASLNTQGHVSVIGHPVSAWWKQETGLHLIYYFFHKSRSVPTNVQPNTEAQRKCATHLAKLLFPCPLSNWKAIFSAICGWSWVIYSSVCFILHIITLIWTWNGVCQSPSSPDENNPSPDTPYLVLENKLSPWQMTSPGVFGT